MREIIDNLIIQQSNLVATAYILIIKFLGWVTRNDFLNAYNEDGLSMLHVAAKHNNPSIVEILLKLGSNPNQLTEKVDFELGHPIVNNSNLKDGIFYFYVTPAVYAVLNDNHIVMELLNSFGSDLENCDQEFNPALKYAAHYFQKPEMVKFLVQDCEVSPFAANNIQFEVKKSQDHVVLCYNADDTLLDNFINRYRAQETHEIMGEGLYQVISALVNFGKLESIYKNEMFKHSIKGMVVSHVYPSMRKDKNNRVFYEENIFFRLPRNAEESHDSSFKRYIAIKYIIPAFLGGDIFLLELAVRCEATFEVYGLNDNLSESLDQILLTTDNKNIVHATFLKYGYKILPNYIQHLLANYPGVEATRPLAQELTTIGGYSQP